MLFRMKASQTVDLGVAEQVSDSDSNVIWAIAGQITKAYNAHYLRFCCKFEIKLSLALISIFELLKSAL